MNEETDPALPVDALHHHAHLSARSLTPVRRMLADWTAAAGLNPDTSDAVVLSGYEALANAVEHAYGTPDGGPVELHATRVGDEVTVTVRDHGSWRAPTSPTSRGRGLVLVRGLSTSADVSTDDRGTTVTMTWLLGD